MKTVRRTSQFRRDVKRMERRGKDFAVFRAVVRDLIVGRTLDPRFRDHVLLGQYAGTRECHIEPDWLLIYELMLNEVVLIRTGTHTDLFD
jgi:mRNA interferase YafQ